MSVDLVSVVVRALGFIAMFQAAGTVVFVALFGQFLSAADAPVRRLGHRSALLAIALVVLYQLLGAARMTGEFSGLADLDMQLLSLSSNVGVANGLRLFGLLLIAGAVTRNHPGWMIATVTGASLVAASYAITGHTAGDPQRWLLAPLLLIHLWVVAFWFGSLWPLLLVSEQETTPVTAAVIERFSALATWLVPGIAMAGVLMAIALLPDIKALFLPYGQLLLVKAAGFAVLLGLAALNKLRLGPAIALGQGGALRSFRRSVLLEYTLICGVLIATAVMTGYFSPEP